MTIKECEIRIEGIKQRFREYFHIDFDVDVFLLGKASVETKRTAIFEICGDELFPFAPTTSGETIHGPWGFAVLMYPFNIKYPSDFDHALCHEFGHVLFGQNNQILLDKLRHVQFHENGGIAAFGLSVWSEFIAECIANLVMKEEPDHIFFPKQEQLIHLLYEALPGLDTSNTAKARKSVEFFLEGYHLNQYALGHYCATFLTDPTIVLMFDVEPQASRGLEECTEDEMHCIDDILDYLCDKIDEDIFWIVDETWLAGLGLLVNALWECRVLHHK